MKYTPVSVVLATYNGAKFLPEQLRSIIGQLREKDELIIVDDCSTDKTVNILEELRDDRIVLLKNRVNRGVFATFELGLNHASNKYILLSDQDDIWLDGKVVAILECFNNSPAKTCLIVSDAKVINSDGDVVRESFMKMRGGFKYGFLNNFVKNRYLGCTLAIRCDLLKLALPFPRYIPQHDIWLGLLAEVYGRTEYISQPLILYRRHGNNTSPGRQGLIQVIRWRVALGWLIIWRMTRNYFRSYKLYVD